MAWYNIPGNEQDTVIFTQYRISRNLAEFPFPTRLDASSAREVIGRVGSILEANGFNKTDFSEISHTTAYSLAEKMYITPDFIRESLPHALYLNEPCNLSAMLCREEHIRLQCILSGFSLKDASDSVAKIETLLDEKFNFAFEEGFGYLTSDPSLLGCATEISVMMFLPALHHFGNIEPIIEKITKKGFVLKKFCEDIFILSNKITHLSECQLVNNFSDISRRIIDGERAARRELCGEELDRIIDNATRAEGILRYAHLLSYNDYIKNSSAVRLGISLGIITDIRTELLTSLLFETLPATLSLTLETPSTRTQSVRSIEKYRANYVKECLQA